jgi:hypothetical protein
LENFNNTPALINQFIKQAELFLSKFYQFNLKRALLLMEIN